jgi:DMSO/TMAO reductase YedYZ heme-binding membrane subunit
MNGRLQRYALAAIPIAMLTLGIPFANRIEPRVFGLPFLLAWIIAWILLTPLFLTLVERGGPAP